MLVAEAGSLVGVMTDKGRALSRQSGAGFVAEVWLENDGLRQTQAEAAARWPHVEARIAEATLGPFRILHVQGKTGAKGIATCQPGEIVISDTDLDLPGDCLLFDAATLQRTGAVAFTLDGDKLRVKTAAEAAGLRIWNGADEPPLSLAAGQ